MIFKKIKVRIGRGNAIADYSGNVVPVEEVIKLLSDPGVIQVTATRMTGSEYFKKNKQEKGNG